MMHRAFAAAVVLACGFFCAADAHADFKATTVSVSIASGPGGGYDTYGRLAARHLGRFLPGNPTVVAKNQPGAGGVVLGNSMYNVAPKDGSAIAILEAGTAYEPLYGNPQAKYDAMKFNWLISLNEAVNIGIFWSATNIETVDDLFKREVLVGSSGGGTTDVYPNLLNSLIGTKFKVVKGYKGTGEAGLAMERGEVNGIVGAELSSLRATKPEWIRDHKIRILLQIGLKKSPDLPDVASAIDLAKDEDNHRVLELLLTRQAFGRPFVAPPGLPSDIVATLRQAFEAMARDQAFLADAAKLHADVVVGTGADIQALVKKTYATPKPLVARAVAELKKAGGLE
jgi:tripartite-type tricarboxylate transporter receptor subunit TctC